MCRQKLILKDRIHVTSTNRHVLLNVTWIRVDCGFIIGCKIEKDSTFTDATCWVCRFMLMHENFHLTDHKFSSYVTLNLCLWPSGPFTWLQHLSTRLHYIRMSGWRTLSGTLRSKGGGLRKVTTSGPFPLRPTRKWWSGRLNPRRTFLTSD